MSLKPEQCVFFLDEITLDMEYELIHNPVGKDRSSQIPICGNHLLLSSKKLMQENTIKFIDLLYDKENQNAFFLTLMLISSDPFYNFLRTWDSNISDKNNYPILYKFKTLLDIIEKGKTMNIEHLICFKGCNSISKGYSDILKNIHRELIGNLIFNKEDWSKAKHLKKIYDKYSPIEEIFHGSLWKKAEGKESSYYVVIDFSEDLCNILNKKSSKKPYVILVRASKISKIDNYRVSSIISTQDSVINLYIINNQRVYKYNELSMEEFEYTNIINDIHGIRYVLYCRKE